MVRPEGSAQPATARPPACTIRGHPARAARTKRVVANQATGNARRCIVTQVDPVYEIVQRPDTRWSEMAQRQSHQADVWVDVTPYPSLKLLCWNLATPRITRRDAFAIYERNWRWIDNASTPAHERAFIDSLAEEFGGGLINA